MIILSEKKNLLNNLDKQHQDLCDQMQKLKKPIIAEEKISTDELEQICKTFETLLHKANELKFDKFELAFAQLQEQKSNLITNY